MTISKSKFMDAMSLQAKLSAAFMMAAITAGTEGEERNDLIRRFAAIMIQTLAALGDTSMQDVPFESVVERCTRLAATQAEELNAIFAKSQP